jgi:predicted DNA-binding protein
MSRDQALSWFIDAPEADLAEVVRTARPVKDDAEDVARVETAIPLMLTSIRLPVELVRFLDEVAAAEGVTRSEAIRQAVARYVGDRRGGVSPSEAQHALDVLRRVVGEHASIYREAA